MSGKGYKRFVKVVATGIKGRDERGEPIYYTQRTVRTAHPGWLTDARLADVPAGAQPVTIGEHRRARGWRLLGDSPAVPALSASEALLVSKQGRLLRPSVRRNLERLSIDVESRLKRKRRKALRKAVKRGRVSQIRSKLNAVMG